MTDWQCPSWLGEMLVQHMDPEYRDPIDDVLQLASWMNTTEWEAIKPHFDELDLSEDEPILVIGRMIRDCARRHWVYDDAPDWIYYLGWHIEPHSAIWRSRIEPLIHRMNDASPHIQNECAISTTIALLELALESFGSRDVSNMKSLIQCWYQVLNGSDPYRVYNSDDYRPMRRIYDGEGSAHTHMTHTLMVPRDPEYYIMDRARFLHCDDSSCMIIKRVQEFTKLSFDELANTILDTWESVLDEISPT